MQLSITVEAAGVVVGSGPIMSASDWNWEPKLDGAGTFSFSMPAGDPKSALLVNDRTVFCYTVINGAVTFIGSGVIDKIEKSPGRPTMLRVSGPDLLSELGDIVVGELVIREQAWTYLNEADKGYLGYIERRENPIPPPTYWLWSGQYTNASDGTAVGPLFDHITLRSRTVAYIENAYYLYVGYDAIFDGIRFYFKTFNVPAGPAFGDTMHLQYYSSTINGWEDLACADGTFVTGTWEQDGDVMFTVPDDWVRYDEAAGSPGNWNWYWIRIKCDQNGADDPREVDADVYEVMVHADFPTVHGVNQIMAFAPAWVTVPAHCHTVWPKYLKFQGESVLTALLMLAEQGGQEVGQAIREHFRLGTGREVEWLGTTITATGLRAIRSYTTDTTAPETVLITDLTQTLDTSDVINRIFAFSNDGIDLSLSDRFVPPNVMPAGYSYGTDARGAYVQHDASVALYGPKELWNIYSEIDQQVANTLTTHNVYTANAVFDAAIEDLRIHAELSKHYSLTVMRFNGLIRVGETIEVVYHEYSDLSHTVDIDTYADGHPLWITGSGLKIDSKGLGTISLEVSTIDRENKTDADVVVELVRQNRRASSGTSSGGSSTPPTPYTAGPDIRVTGYVVQRAGTSVLLFDSGGALLREYAADATGLAAALAAAASGDVVGDWTGTIVGSVTIPAGVTLKGRSRDASIIDGLVTGGATSKARALSVIRVANQVGVLAGVTVGATGTMYLDDVTVDCQNSGGPAYDIEMILGGGITARETELLAEVGTDGYAAWIEHGSFRHESGKAKGTTATHPYWLEV